MRPVPVVLRLMAFLLQLSIGGKEAEDAVKQVGRTIWGLTLAHLGSGIGALGAGLLLLVEGALTAASAEGVALGVALTKTSGTFGLNSRKDSVKSMDGLLGGQMGRIPFD